MAVAAVNNVAYASVPRYRNWLLTHLMKGSNIDRWVLSPLDAVYGHIRLGEYTDDVGCGKQLVCVEFPPDYEFSGRRSRFRQASFRKSVLRGAIFRRAHLAKTLWVGADLESATFDRCLLSGASFNPSRTTDLNLIRCVFDSSRIEAVNHARFVECDLRGARIIRGLSGSHFSGCRFDGISLRGLNLAGCRFVDCSFAGCDFGGADLTGCGFTGCNLERANWADCIVTGAALSGCSIYGMGLWSTVGELGEARSLLIKHPSGAAIEVDGLHIAVFISALLGGGGVRELVDGLASTVVLVLGRFAGPHMEVLQAIRTELQRSGYTAIVFDSGVPRTRDTTETVQILGRISRFVIVDATEPRSVPHEIEQFVSAAAVPMQVITLGERPFSMASDLLKYPWVLPFREFDGLAAVLAAMPEMVGALEELRDSRQRELASRRDAT